jgi:hypothetical protein
MKATIIHFITLNYELLQPTDSSVRCSRPVIECNLLTIDHGSNAILICVLQISVPDHKIEHRYVLSVLLGQPKTNLKKINFVEKVFLRYKKNVLRTATSNFCMLTLPLHQYAPN